MPRLGRILVLLWLLVAPTASGLTVDLAAPEAIPREGTPFALDVAVEDASGPVEVKAWLGGESWQASRTWNASAFQRSDHYALALDPGSDGRWEGRIWVKANPDSNNADRLFADELAVGIRARSAGESADALAPVDPLAWNTSAWAAAGPGDPVAIREGSARLVELGAPGGSRPLAVPAPATGLDVCHGETCEAEAAWRLERVGDEDIEIVARADAKQAAPGVLVADGQACRLPANATPRARWQVSLDDLDREGACRSATGSPAAARLLARGHELTRVPERPGRGDVVRDPVDGGWAPWRLPPGIEPEPVQTQLVEGKVTAFGTRTDGLAMLEEALALARERVTVSTYLLTSRPVADLLAQTAARGVDVHLWLEPDPVGGQPGATAPLVDRLQARGVEVHEAPGPTRSGLQHAKVLVVDSGLVLVMTENLTEHGLPSGSEGNLGVGVGVANATLASRLEATFQEPGEPRELEPEGWSDISAPVTVLRAPENAWRSSGVPAWIEASEGPMQGAVLRANPRWGPSANPWLDAMVNHSRQAPVDLVLSGAPEGAARSNREAVAYLEAHPRADELSARLSDPRGGTVHAKALATPQAALVGSSNWGLGGALLNREVNLLVHDPAVASRVAEILTSPEPSARDGFLPGDAPVPGPGLAGLGLAVLAGARLGSRARRRRERSRSR